jgi:hypothetical protein
MFDMQDLDFLMILLLQHRATCLHDKTALNVCAQCRRVSCLDCTMLACGCGLGGDDDEVGEGGIVIED